MRVNIDSKVHSDPRVLRMAKALGLRRTDIVGCLSMAWLIAYERADDVVRADDVDLMTDTPGFAATMVLCELADERKNGRVRLRGVAERIEWILKQRERGRAGGKRRVVNASVMIEDSAQANAKPTLEQAPKQTLKPTSSLSPALALALSPALAPSQEIKDYVEPAVSTPPVASNRNREAGELAARVLAYLAEKAGRGVQLRLNAARRTRIARLMADGWTFDDFRVVVWSKTLGPQRWLGDPKMDQFVRFETLFGTQKAEAYREQAKQEFTDANPQEAERLGWVRLNGHALELPLEAR